MKTKLIARGEWLFEARDKDGNLKWTERIPNLIVNAGLDKMLDDTFNASGYTSAWYVGLKGAGSPAAGDTMASHGGWSEVTDYSEANRQAYTTAAASGQAVTNSASKAEFSINGTCTVAGAFLSTDNTKGGSTGTLLSAGDFAASRSLLSGDTLSVTYQVSLSAS